MVAPIIGQRDERASKGDSAPFFLSHKEISKLHCRLPGEACSGCTWHLYDFWGWLGVMFLLFWVSCKMCKGFYTIRFIHDCMDDFWINFLHLKERIISISTTMWDSKIEHFSWLKHTWGDQQRTRWSRKAAKVLFCSNIMTVHIIQKYIDITVHAHVRWKEVCFVWDGGRLPRLLQDCSNLIVVHSWHCWDDLVFYLQLTKEFNTGKALLLKLSVCNLLFKMSTNLKIFFVIATFSTFWYEAWSLMRSVFG